ncbi:hypothetical protein [Streptomyces sp. NPDC058157]|uniref:hypothetical protein n=1 Tax=Streptomyces sp. NPDC058157 TaxID=3346360 RepID=UPI0036E0B7B9
MNHPMAHPLPVPDPRARYVAPDHAGMDDLVAGLVVPRDASMYVMGAELILLDADTAGLVLAELNGGLDDRGVATLWSCIADFDKVIPLINSEYCASYFARLRTTARLAAARYTPAADA